MKWFGKKKETKSCCGGNRASEIRSSAESRGAGDSIKILGSGCAKCTELELAVRTAVSELSLDYKIDHVTDFAEIASYGVMSTPALVLNGKVISCGKVLTAEEVKARLAKQ